MTHAQGASPSHDWHQELTLLPIMKKRKEVSLRCHLERHGLEKNREVGPTLTHYLPKSAPDIRELTDFVDSVFPQRCDLTYDPPLFLLWRSMRSSENEEPSSVESTAEQCPPIDLPGDVARAAT